MVRLSGGMKRGTVWVAVCAAAALLACATTPDTDSSAAPGADRAFGAGEAQELGRVEVESLDDETRIVLTGLEDPAYTVEPTSGGAGLVVELSGVSQPAASLFDALSGGDTQVSVYDGLVDVVSASTYEGADAPVTRIEVTFAEPAEYEVVPGTDGLGIVVRRGASPTGDPDMLAEAGMEADADAGMDAEASLDASATDDPWSVAESMGGLETDAELPSAEAEALWAADNEAPAPSPAMETRPSEPATKLSGVAAETTQAGVLLHLQADGMLVNAETFTLEDPARLVIDLPGIASDVPQDKIGIESAWVQRVRIGAHPDKLRVVLDGGPNVAAFQGRRVLPTVDGLVLTVGSGADLDEALAARVADANQSMQIASTETADAPASLAAAAGGKAERAMASEASGSGAEAGWDAMAAGQPAARAASAGAAPAEIYGLQYDRDDDRDRIAVLADRVVDYEILTPDAETVLVRIENAVIAGSVGERITPELGGPISLVTTFRQPEVPDDEVRVVVRRAPGLEPRVTRRGSLLFLDFENTGVAASPPPAFIPGEPRPAAGERRANTFAVKEADGRTQEMTIDADPMADAGMEDESYTALPTFEEPASAAGGLEPLDDMPAASPAATADAVPASLEGPAAVDLLEEGGLIDGKKYAGRRISLDFKDVQIADVLRLIAEVSDLNIIAGDEVQGTVTIRLVDVPWDQALDVILLTKGLGFVRVGNVLRIAPAEILKVEEEVRLQERRNKEKLEDLEVKLQPVNYASVDDVQELVRRLLSARGTVNTDKRTNTLIIKDISSVIDEATALIQAIDTQTPQVLIEAKIVEANLEFGRELGSSWGFGTQPWVDGFNPGIPRTDLGNENFKWAGNNNVIVGNPITSVATGAVNFGAFLLDERMQVEVHIEAAEKAGDGKVISSPRVVTLDNREATIEQGVSIPFQTFEGGDAKLEFIDAVLSLKVTPHITTDKSIIMDLEVTRNAPDASVSTPTGSPAIAKNQAKTETLVKDGQTLVIGGIYTIDKTTRETRVPYLHRIPVLGAAFKSRELSDLRKELLIFVTPRIVVNPALASAE